MKWRSFFGLKKNYRKKKPYKKNLQKRPTKKNLQKKLTHKHTHTKKTQTNKQSKTNKQQQLAADIFSPIKVKKIVTFRFEW